MENVDGYYVYTIEDNSAPFWMTMLTADEIPHKIIIKGSVSSDTHTYWAIAAAYSDLYSAKGNFATSNVDSKTEIGCPIFGAYLDGGNNKTFILNAIENKVQLTNTTHGPEDRSSVTSMVYGGYIYDSNGEANSNSVELKNFNVTSEVVGAYVLAANSDRNQGAAKSNSVSLSGTEIGGYVIGGFVSGKFTQGSATANAVDIKNSVIKGYVSGGTVDGAVLSGNANSNVVNLLNTSVEGGSGMGVSGGYAIGTNSGNASLNEVTVGIDSSLNETVSKINNFVVGGLIGWVNGTEDVRETNQNKVCLLNNEKDKILEVNGYVAGGVNNRADGAGHANYNSVLIGNPAQADGSPQGGVFGSVNITQYVLGGLVSTAISGSSNNNTVTIQASDTGKIAIGWYVGGGLYQGSGAAESNGNAVFIEGKPGARSSIKIDGYVLGGQLDASASGSTSQNNVVIKNSSIETHVTGGYNSGSGGVSSNENEVYLENVSVVPSGSNQGGFVVGGLISGKGSGAANANIVTIKDSEVKQYITGGSNQGSGLIYANNNTVSLENVKVLGNDTVPADKQTDGFVVGGLIGGDGTGDTNNNTVIITDGEVTLYVTGGYNQGAGEVSINQNIVALKDTIVGDSGSINGRFIAGGILSSEKARGDVSKNTVSLVDGKFKGKYIAGGVSQGTGSVKNNEVRLVNSQVEGFVAGGLDWWGKDVTLTQNKVTVEGGSVLGRIAGARSWSGQDANDNIVDVKGVEVKAGGEYKGHVLGAANQAGGNTLRNQVFVKDSHVEGYVAGGFIEHIEGGVNDGRTDGNVVVIENSDVDGNIGGV